MFTGIIEDLGRIVERVEQEGHLIWFSKPASSQASFASVPAFCRLACLPDGGPNLRGLASRLMSPTRP